MYLGGMVMTSIIHCESSLKSSHLLAKTSIEGTFIRFDKQFVIERASTTCINLFGFTYQELVGKSLSFFMHPDDLEKMSWYYNQFMKSNIEPNYFKCFFRMKTRERKYEWFEMILWMKNSFDESTHGFIGYFKHAKKFTKYYEVFTSQKKWFQCFLEDLAQPVAILFEDVYIYANQAYINLFFDEKKYSVFGISISTFFNQETAKWIEQKLRSLEDNDIEEEKNLVTFTNNVIDAFIRVSRIDEKSCPLVKIEVEDFYEKKKIQEVMINSEKLSAVGQLAAGIVHEIRNPLTAIKGFIQLLQTNRHPYLKIALDEINRIETIISELLLLSKPQTKKVKKVNLFCVIEQVIELIRPHALMNNVQIHLEKWSSTLTILCDRHQLTQVFLNIIKNAIEAIEKKGNIYIHIMEQFSSFEVVIRDEGIGIPKDFLHKIRQPFFTTKEKGTGLGLMICDQIIKEHGGTITFENIGTGTTVTITLPKTTT